MQLSPADIASQAEQLAAKSPREILRHAFARFDAIAISFSGAEDVVLIDMAVKLNKAVQVFSIDTGRLHPETYRFIDRVREHYQIPIELLFPDADQVRQLVNAKGLFSFYRDGHQECCQIRKTNPLRAKLAALDGWITGQRRDQSPSTRQQIPVMELDPAFSSEARQLVKFNPLANWSSQQVWDYIRSFDLPYNPLHERGFFSIGCEPCTRPVLPGQHEREGRWWWEEAAHKECGLHVINLK